METVIFGLEIEELCHKCDQSPLRERRGNTECGDGTLSQMFFLFKYSIKDRKHCETQARDKNRSLLLV